MDGADAHGQHRRGSESRQRSLEAAGGERESTREYDSVVGDLRVPRENHPGEGEGCHPDGNGACPEHRLFDCVQRPRNPTSGEDDGMVPRCREEPGERVNECGEERAQSGNAERTHEKPHAEAGEYLVAELVRLESDVVHAAIDLERQEEIRRRVEDRDLRVGVDGDAAQNMGVPQRELAGRHSRERIALPHEMLVQEIAAKDLAVSGIEREELPVQREREDDESNKRCEAPESTQLHDLSHTGVNVLHFRGVLHWLHWCGELSRFRR